MRLDPVSFGLATQTMACHNDYIGAGMSLTHTGQ